MIYERHIFCLPGIVLFFLEWWRHFIGFKTVLILTYRLIQDPFETTFNVSWSANVYIWSSLIHSIRDKRHNLMYLCRENLKFKCVCGYGQLDIFDRKFACTKYCFTNGISRRFVTITKKSNYFSCLHKKSSYDNVQILHQMWFQNLNKAHQKYDKSS